MPPAPPPIRSPTAGPALPTEIAPGVFVGGRAAAADFPGLRMCVLDAGEDAGVPSERLPVYDPEEERPIRENLERIATAVRDARSRGEPVLIFCGHGVRRSPLAAAWYLHRAEGISLGAAYDRIERVRPFIERPEQWLRGSGALEAPSVASGGPDGVRSNGSATASGPGATPPPALRLVPLSDDRPAAERLLTAAVEARARAEVPPQDPAPAIAWAVECLRSGSIEGRMVRDADVPVGVVAWEGTTELGRRIRAIYLEQGAGSADRYAALFDLAEREFGPFQIVPAGWNGLAREAEAELLRSRGFARYARSEMRMPFGTPLPVEPAPSGVRIRAVGPDDEPALAAHHAAAFTGHFDSYLFRSDPDPRRDSERSVREMLAGRWGEFLPWASTVAESEDGSSLGSCLFVRAPFGPLLISLQVDPAVQGRGVGRALTLASLHALRARGESIVALNVTEGNEPAVRLYTSLGFVRSIGPSSEWYSERLVPVRPDRAATRRPRSTDGSRGGAANRSRSA